MAAAGPRYNRPTYASKTATLYPEKPGPSTSQILAIVTLFPLGFLLLCLAAVTLAGTLIASAVAAPLLILFSPIIVPAVFAIAAAVGGVLTSGAFGVTALSSASWVVNYVRRMGAKLSHEQFQSERERQRLV